MFGNIPFIIEMQDQEAIDSMITIGSYNYELTREEAEKELFYSLKRKGIDFNMLSPRVQRKINNFLCLYGG